MKQVSDDQRRLYSKLMWLASLSFLCMYLIIYALIDVFGNEGRSSNHLLMAGILTLPMIIIEIVLMGGMYRNRSINLVVILLSIITFIAWYCLIHYN